MPVFFVTINEIDGIPELTGLTTTQPTREAAIAWTVANENIDLRTCDVDVLTTRTDCWYQAEPEMMQ